MNRHNMTHLFLGIAMSMLSLPLVAQENGAKPVEQQKPAPNQVVFGKVTAVDAAKSSVTLTGKKNEVKTVTTTANTKIQVGGITAPLTAVKVGMYGSARLAEDGSTALMLQARSIEQTAGAPKLSYSGQITAIDAAQSKIAFTNKEGQSKAFTLTPNTKIEVNNKPGTLAEVQPGMYGGVQAGPDGSPLLLRVYSAGKDGKRQKN